MKSKILDTGLGVLGFLAIVAVAILAAGFDDADAQDAEEMVPISKGLVKQAGGSSEWYCFGNDRFRPTRIECIKATPTPTPTPLGCNVAHAGHAPKARAGDGPIVRWRVNFDQPGDHGVDRPPHPDGWVECPDREKDGQSWIANRQHAAGLGTMTVAPIGNLFPTPTRSSNSSLNTETTPTLTATALPAEPSPTPTPTATATPTPTATATPTATPTPTATATPTPSAWSNWLISQRTGCMNGSRVVTETRTRVNGDELEREYRHYDETCMMIGD